MFCIIIIFDVISDLRATDVSSHTEIYYLIGENHFCHDSFVFEYLGIKFSEGFIYFANCRHVNLIINKSDLEKSPEGPKVCIYHLLWLNFSNKSVSMLKIDRLMCLMQVVLASMASLEVGSSHDIFVEWAAEAKNLVLFTEKGQVWILQLLYQICCYVFLFDAMERPDI